MSLTIEKALVASTAHLTEETAKHLTEVNGYGLVVYPKGDYGWWIWVPTLEVEHTAPAELVALLDLARKNDCIWLMLDRDAFTVPELPTYDW